MTRSVNDAPDLLFLFYPETETAVAAGNAPLARIAAQPDLGPTVTAEAFMGSQGDLDMARCAARLSVIRPVATAPDAKLVLYPDAGHAFLFQEIEDFAAQVDLFLA